MIWLWIALGGAAGSCLRHLAGTGVRHWLGPAAFPWGTLAVNAAGCLAIGILAPALVRGSQAHALLVVGVLGGFTTFSAFSWETVELLGAGQWPTALAYAGTTMAVCLLATAAGWWSARALAVA